MTRLYHYTARHHAAEIRLSGAIARGGVPIPSDDGQSLAGIVPGWQWLTTSEDWRQTWATRRTVRCDRTECRLVIDIPIVDHWKLRRWDAAAPSFGFDPDAAARFARIGGGADVSSSSWYIFQGSIPYAWVVEIQTRPGGALARARR